MAQIDDFFMYENRVEGITDADYQRAQPYVEAAQAFAQTTYQSIYIIDYFRKNFLYVSDNPLFLCGHTADEVRQMGYGFYLSHVPEDEVPMLTELNRSGFRAFYDEPVENRRQCMMSYDFHITHGDRLLLVNHKITPLAMTPEGRVWLKSYEGTKSTGEVKEVIGLDIDLTGRTVVIVEDIVDTGATIAQLVGQLKEKGAADVRVCTFSLKTDVYQRDIKLDYVGIEIANKFIVGWGLDYDQMGRQLSDIYILKDQLE